MSHVESTLQAIQTAGSTLRGLGASLAQADLSSCARPGSTCTGLFMQLDILLHIVVHDPKLTPTVRASILGEHRLIRLDQLAGEIRSSTAETFDTKGIRKQTSKLLAEVDRMYKQHRHDSRLRTSVETASTVRMDVAVRDVWPALQRRLTDLLPDPSSVVIPYEKENVGDEDGEDLDAEHLYDILRTMIEDVRLDPQLDEVDKNLLISDPLRTWVEAVRDRYEVFSRCTPAERVGEEYAGLSMDINALSEFLVRLHQRFLAQRKLSVDIGNKVDAVREALVQCEAVAQRAAQAVRVENAPQSTAPANVSTVRVQQDPAWRTHALSVSAQQVHVVYMPCSCQIS